MPLLKYGEGKEEADILMRYIDNRIKKFKTATLALTGNLGTGKSYTCLRIAELWYKYHFNEEFPIKNVCFDVISAIELLNSGELRKGEIIILEEGGVLIHSKKFQSDVNIFFGFQMQTFRQEQIIVLFNCPVFDLMDKTTRILINANFITQRIDRENKLCIVKPLFNQLNQQSGKIYHHYLRVRGKSHGYSMNIPIKRMEFGLPSLKLREEYEGKKKEFRKKLGERTLKKLKKEEPKPKHPLKCNQCGYQWDAFVPDPRRCPDCHKRTWNKPKIEQNA